MTMFVVFVCLCTLFPRKNAHSIGSIKCKMHAKMNRHIGQSAKSIWICKTRNSRNVKHWRTASWNSRGNSRTPQRCDNLVILTSQQAHGNEKGKKSRCFDHARIFKMKHFMAQQRQKRSFRENLVIVNRGSRRLAEESCKERTGTNHFCLGWMATGRIEQRMEDQIANEDYSQTTGHLWERENWKSERKWRSKR